jgi:hypothetical protein
MTEQPSNHPSTEGVGRRLIENTFEQSESVLTIAEISELIAKSKDIVQVISVQCEQEDLKQVLQVVKDHVAEMPKLKGLHITGPKLPFEKPVNRLPMDYYFDEKSYYPGWCGENRYKNAKGLQVVEFQGAAIKEELAMEIIEILSPKLDSFLNLPQVLGLFACRENTDYCMETFLEETMGFRCFTARCYEWGTKTARSDIRKLVSGIPLGIRFGGFDLVEKQPNDWVRRVYHPTSDPFWFQKVDFSRFGLRPYV